MQVLFLSKGTTGNALVSSLRDDRFQVNVVRSLPKIIEAIPFPYDLVVVDLTSIGTSGVEIVREVRMLSDQVLILVLGGALSVETKLLYFELGIDDFLVAPMVEAEFLARVRASLRRLKASRHDILIVAELRLDRLSHRVFWREHEINLTNKEFMLLEHLMLNREKLVTRQDLAEQIWHTSLEENSNTVDVFIRQLRRKIDDRYQQKLIHTVRGHGYMIRENGTVPRRFAVAENLIEK